MDENLFPDEWIQLYLLGVYTEAITVDTLSVDYHSKVGGELEKGVNKGFGGHATEFKVGTKEYETAIKLRKNIYAFSAAKQYQQVRTMSKLIDVGGNKTSFKEFRALADHVFDEYNKNYLKTEYNTAIGQAQNAREWVNAVNQMETFPTLEYRTQRDSHVRDEHAVLDGIIRTVNDPFWNMYMPKNGWNCRCFVVQHEGTKVTDLKDHDLSDLNDEKKFPKVFRMNPGKDGLIFNPKYHPYFFVDKGDAGLKANNFNLAK